MYSEQEVRGELHRTLRIVLSEKNRHEERIGKPLDDVRAILYALALIRLAFGYVKLEDMPEQAFRDVLMYLRDAHSARFNMSDFALAAGYSKGYLNSMISRQPRNRARCCVHPSQYKKLLAIFSRPGRYVSPTGPYGRWPR